MSQYKITLEKYNSSLSDEQKLEIKKVRNEMLVAKEKKKNKAVNHFNICAFSIRRIFCIWNMYFKSQELKEWGRPKQPMSSYLLFCQEHRGSFNGSNVVEFQTQMKNKWYGLSENEKSMWNDKARKLKDDFR